jgi:hypothetical protein
MKNKLYPDINFISLSWSEKGHRNLTRLSQLSKRILEMIQLDPLYNRLPALHNVEDEGDAVLY